MTRRTIITITTIAAAGLLGVGVAGPAVAGRLADDAEQPIRGDALVKATDAALAHTGGGTVTETEMGDEDSLYEVEVTLDSGAQVDVQLDESFQVVDATADSETDG